MMEYNDIIGEIDQIVDWLIHVRRDFHMHPELSTEEFHTKQKIKAFLKEMGIPFREFEQHNGIEALIEGGLEGKTVALRADMDALPITDIKEVPYKSRELGKMHACGHDAHMTVQLGAAKILKKNSHLLKGNVKLIFQPAEETVGGAKPMIADGVLENPVVDMIFGLHVSPDINSGSIGVRYGQMNASSDAVKMTLQGKSSHGAYPHEGVDAIVMAGYAITALQTIVSRNTDPREGAVVTLGVIKGGELANIIADKVELTGTIRTLEEKLRTQTLERIQQLMKGISESMGGECEVELQEGYPTLINHKEAVDIVKENGIKLLGVERVFILDKASMGVEDFAYFLQQVPGAFFRLGSGNPEKNASYPGHNNRFDVDENCLAIGVKLQVMNVLRFLNDEHGFAGHKDGYI